MVAHVLIGGKIVNKISIHLLIDVSPFRGRMERIVKYEVRSSVF